MDGSLVTIFKDPYSVFEIEDADFDKWVKTDNILFDVFDFEKDSDKQLLYNIYTGYRNYKKYISESKNVDFNYVIELFVSDNTYPFPLGLNIIVLEVIENKNKETELNILCPEWEIKNFYW